MIAFASQGVSLLEADLAAFERNHEVVLPEEYRSFLAANDGAEPEDNALVVPGVDAGVVSVERFLSRAGIEETLRILGDRLPKGLLPIADAAGGNLVLIDVGNDAPGRICFWDHERENADPISTLTEGFHDLLEGLCPGDEIELPQGAVEEAEVWIDPSFKDEMRRRGLLDE